MDNIQGVNQLELNELWLIWIGRWKSNLALRRR